MRKPWRFYSLQRPKLRQSWNKYNFYNIARAVGKEPLVKGRATFFQQKWAAKAKTRSYHGEHVSEKKWVRLFSRRLQSAVDLPPEYLAANDGSEQAAGRGSGLSSSTLTAETYSQVPPPSLQTKPPSHPAQRSGGFGNVNETLSQHFEKMTPYMQMTFAPLERRLDTAIFRALFASSVRQARQFVIHGAVKVNGKKMVHPSYQLNPGDMFQVEIEKVLYGTGEQKQGTSNAELKQSVQARKKKEEKDAKWIASKYGKESEATKGEAPEGEAAEGEGAEGEEGEAIEASAELSPEGELHLNVLRIRRLRRSAREILQGDSRDLSAKQKKELRLFRDAAQRFLARPDAAKLDSVQLLDELAKPLNNISSKLPGLKKKADPTPGGEAKEGKGLELTSEEKAERAERTGKWMALRKKVLDKGLEGIKSNDVRRMAYKIMERDNMTKAELKRLAIILRNDEENPVDDSKPYVTPWRPRPFMSAFAFIPRYLEVNPNICAAVYLRHPVARKGMAEVPTPFSYLTNQLAHNWYLGRG